MALLTLWEVYAVGNPSIITVGFRSLLKHINKVTWCLIVLNVSDSRGSFNFLLFQVEG